MGPEYSVSNFQSRKKISLAHKSRFYGYHAAIHSILHRWYAHLLPQLDQICQPYYYVPIRIQFLAHEICNRIYTSFIFCQDCNLSFGKQTRKSKIQPNSQPQNLKNVLFYSSTVENVSDLPRINFHKLISTMCRIWLRPKFLFRYFQNTLPFAASHPDTLHRIENHRYVSTIMAIGNSNDVIRPIHIY